MTTPLRYDIGCREWVLRLPEIQHAFPVPSPFLRVTTSKNDLTIEAHHETRISISVTLGLEIVHGANPKDSYLRPGVRIGASQGLPSDPASALVLLDVNRAAILHALMLHTIVQHHRVWTRDVPCNYCNPKRDAGCPYCGLTGVRTASPFGGTPNDTAP